jgi:membrane dipeptidase
MMTRNRGALVLLGAGALALARLSSAQQPAAPATDVAARAKRIHGEAIVIDTHIDVTQKMMQPGWDFFARHSPPVRGRRGQGGGGGAGDPSSMVDFPRMKEGGLDGIFFSIYMSGRITGETAVKRALAQIDTVRKAALSRPDDVALCTTAAQVRAAAKAGKVAALMGMEGGHMINESLPQLREYAKLGVRYLTLTHSVNTTWADSSGEKPLHDGLTAFGKAVVKELNALGMMVDVSHVADKTFWDALATSRAPLLASHSSCRALSGHPRNMTDEMIKAMAAKGGVIQINYLDAYLDDALYRAQDARRPQTEAKRAELEKEFPGEENQQKRFQALREYTLSLGPLPTVSWEKIVEHIDHAAKVAGWEHVGLGSDFDGATMPVGMEDVTQLPKIAEALLKKGYSEQQVKGILGENLLKLMEKVERAASGS